MAGLSLRVFEDFQDFTTATPWEGLAASIEEAFHSWVSTGLTRAHGRPLACPTTKSQAVLEHNLPQRHCTYLLNLRLPSFAQRCIGSHLNSTGAGFTAKLAEQAHSNVESLSTQPFSKLDPMHSWLDDRQGNAANDHGASDHPSDRRQRPEESKEETVLAKVRTMPQHVLDEESNEEPSTSTTHASAFSDADSRSASERPFTPSADPAYSTDDDTSSASEEEEGAPLFPQRTGNHSPTPSMEDAGAAALEERTKDQAMQEYAKIRTWFAVEAFVTLVPNSYSGRIMDEQEAHVLLSALAVAAASSKFTLACFIPVHDGLRDAYWGIAPAGGLTTRHFETDSVHISSPPSRLLLAEGQLALFAERLRPHTPYAAAQCLQAAQEARESHSEGSRAGPHIFLRRTYRLPRPRAEGASSRDSDDEEEPALWTDQWDAGCAWWPWASQADPCKDLELDVEWLDVDAANAIDPGYFTPANTTCWQVHALTQHHSSWSLRPTFLMQSSSASSRPEALRQHLRLDSPSSPQACGEENMDTPRNGSLAAMLASLWEGRATALQAGTIGQLASSEWWGRRGSTFPNVPSESTLQDVLRDLFGAISLPSAFSGSQFINNLSSAPDLGDLEDAWGFSKGLPKCAPASSLAARLALHALTFSNPRAVATLWYRFVRELRFAYWEPRIEVPRLSGPSKPAEPDSTLPPLRGQPLEHTQEPPLPDLGSGLLHQKLQMLNICIFRQRRREQSCSGLQQAASARGSGSAGTVEGVCLIGGGRGPMQAPLTQPPPVLTRDMLSEREAALSALGTSSAGENARAWLQGDFLTSDMSAFKAANPGALLEDFVRWNATRDWEPDAGLPNSGRMPGRINAVWSELWERAVALPAAEQKPLMDSQLEGERVMHWFEHQLLPDAFWSELLPVALSTATACLAACTSSRLPIVAAELQKFHEGASAMLDAGLPLDTTFLGLLSSFQRLESLVVAAESLVLRLPAVPDLVCRLLTAATTPSRPDRADAALEEHPPVHYQLGSTSPFWELDGVNAGVLVKAGAEMTAISKLLMGGTAHGSRDSLSDTRWAPELQSEWIIEVETAARDCGALHRMYTAVRPGESRIATSIVAEL